MISLIKKEVRRERNNHIRDHNRSVSIISSFHRFELAIKHENSSFRLAERRNDWAIKQTAYCLSKYKSSSTTIDQSLSDLIAKITFILNDNRSNSGQFIKLFVVLHLRSPPSSVYDMNVLSQTFDDGQSPFLSTSSFLTNVKMADFVVKSENVCCCFALFQLSVDRCDSARRLFKDTHPEITFFSFLVCSCSWDHTNDSFGSKRLCFFATLLTSTLVSFRCLIWCGLDVAAIYLFAFPFECVFSYVSIVVDMPWTEAVAEQSVWPSIEGHCVCVCVRFRVIFIWSSILFVQLKQNTCFIIAKSVSLFDVKWKQNEHKIKKKGAAPPTSIGSNCFDRLAVFVDLDAFSFWLINRGYVVFGQNSITHTNTCWI